MIYVKECSTYVFFFFFRVPMFSSKSFIVSGLMLMSLIYFELIFVYGVRKCSTLILLYVAVQIS